ncbi:MAG: hypothetical protein SGJ05_03290 [bacterium]|nr:hypothetical protein [bacterium]
MQALPKFSLLNGSRCSGCHVNVAGGGQRNDLGWYSYSDVSIIPREGSFISGLYASDTTNAFFDNKLFVGLDVRAQSTRSFFAPDAPRIIIPMQGTIYAAFKPFQDGVGLSFEAQFNTFGLRKQPNSDQRVRFPGQRIWMASATWQPEVDLPAIRVGQFRPAYGIRYDDHTMFPYSVVNSISRQTIVGPDWAEAGAEVSYEGLPWLTAQVGVFGTSGLAEVKFQDSGRLVSAVAGNAPTLSARVVGWPQFMDDFINAYVGASILNNGDFNIMSGFLGVGLTDYVALAADYTLVQKGEIVQANNLSLELTAQVWSPVLPFVRYEIGTSQQRTNAKQSAQSTVIGAHIFVMPYVELRPEYRIWDTVRPGLTARWNLQLHIFY